LHFDASAIQRRADEKETLYCADEYRFLK